MIIIATMITTKAANKNKIYWWPSITKIADRH